MRRLGDITNQSLKPLMPFPITTGFSMDPKASPDSGTELDADTGWCRWSTQILDPFDFAIESDNIARSLATEFANHF